MAGTHSLAGLHTEAKATLRRLSVPEELVHAVDDDPEELNDVGSSFVSPFAAVVAPYSPGTHSLALL